MKILIKYSLVSEKKEANMNNKMMWYDGVKEEMQYFEGGKLSFKYQEDPYLVSMTHEERIQKNVVSNYRLLPEVESVSFKINNKKKNKDKIDKAIKDFNNYDGYFEIEEEGEDTIIGNINDNEGEDFCNTLERNNIEFEII
jgi:hypothetical protein